MDSVLQQLQVYLRGTETVKVGGWRNPLPPVVCTDGFQLSVQAGEGVYCTPRNNVGPWDAVEVGFPSMVEPLLFPYAESLNEEEPPETWYTNAIYPYVPTALVAVVIEAHGGFQTVPGPCWSRE